MTAVKEIMMKAWHTANEEKKGVSFSQDVQLKSDSDNDNGRASSCGMSSRSFGSTSFDRSSRESSPEALPRKSPKGSILKKRVPLVDREEDSSVENTPRKLQKPRKKSVKMAGFKSPPPNVEEVETSVQEEGGLSKEGGIRFMNNDPYTSNPESAGESEAE